jgi:hypothetical protein
MITRVEIHCSQNVPLRWIGGTIRHHGGRGRTLVPGISLRKNDAPKEGA